MDFEALTSCAELTTEHAEEAARSSSSMRALFAWATRVARPSEGAPKILMAIARLVNAEWVEGTPRVEITGDESSTTISIFADHGMGIRERLLPPARFAVSRDEFTRAVRLAPRLITPFVAEQQGETLVLAPSGANDGVVEVIKIDASSLIDEHKTTPPPTVKTNTAEPNAERSGVHTHPTVRRMVAVVPEALRSGGDDD